MMHLALELGMTLSQLETSMEPGELWLWGRYARKFRLPTRRLELYLAQTSQSMRGGPLSDHLLTPSEEEVEEQPVLAAAAADLATAAGGLVIRRRKPRQVH